nr:MAG TPA: tail sheath protein [Caudoviricetes sp.]
MIGTKIILEDQSYIPSLNVADSTTRPIVFAGFTSDKGTEEYTKWQGEDFFDQYGEISFARHGQPLLQAANVINNGGIVYAKRVVDPTSRLAMLGVVAHVKEISHQETRIKMDPLTGSPITKEDGSYVTEELYWKAVDVAQFSEPAQRPLYTKDEAGADGVAAMFKVCQVNYSVETLDAEENVHGNDYVATSKAFYDKYKNKKDNKFPLFLVMDNGRGVSQKSITISLDSTLSRSAQSARYVIDIDENNNTLESIVFSLNPSEVEAGYNLFFDSVVKRTSKQVKCFGYEDQMQLFYAKVAAIAGLSETRLRESDIIGARTWKGEAFKTFEVLESTNDGVATVKLDSFAGHALVGGYNGDTFGTSPISNYKGVTDSTSVYATEMAKVYNGTFNDDIFDIDNNPIDIVVDANYPHIVKRAIENLCNFRQDVFFFRDMGTKGLTNILAIKNAKTLNTGGNTRYVATYCQYFDVFDPYTRKQITVTMGYAISRLICMHFANGRSLVCAGQNNGWVVPEIIEGTLSYVPKVTPAGDQVAEMDDLHINFGKYYNGIFSLASEYTSQDIYTQLSFANNVLAIQELIKQIRIACPKSRYKFITGTDFEDYKKDVQAVIDANANKFASIAIDFKTDSVYAANKIVYAVIQVSFRDFAQAEIFRIVAIPIATTNVSATV